MLKIITGSVKGKHLKSLEGEHTRPTSERIKEAMFSSIQFDIEDRRVLDIFAGSGQLGLEALSRGAESCTFIDSSREAMDIVRANIALCGFESRYRPLFHNALKYIIFPSTKYLNKPKIPNMLHNVPSCCIPLSSSIPHRDGIHLSAAL